MFKDLVKGMMSLYLARGMGDVLGYKGCGRSMFMERCSGAKCKPYPKYNARVSGYV